MTLVVHKTKVVETEQKIVETYLKSASGHVTIYRLFTHLIPSVKSNVSKSPVTSIHI